MTRTTSHHVSGKLSEHPIDAEHVIDNFDYIKKLLRQSFDKMKDKPLFRVEVDRDEIWATYLEGFSDADRQEHNCGACRAFLRQYGGLVCIEENKVVSIWDDVRHNIAPDFQGFHLAIQNLGTYIHSHPITDVFLSDTAKCGTDKTRDSKREVVWQHFFIEVPAKYVKKSKDIATLLAGPRDNKNVLKRALTELTLDATETVLELIAQESLYRGKEHAHLLDQFVLLQRQYKRIPEQDQDNFCWMASAEAGTVVSRIRNTAIGTLLIDLSAGVTLDDAVTKFERVVAPHNYKRPTALVTPRMVEDAKSKLSELGLLTSLERRYATEADIEVFNLLFKDKPQVIKDVFDEISKDTLVNPRTLAKVEEIQIEDFIKNVVPTATSIHVLVENRHLNNLVSLLAPQDPAAPTLFKWGNGFSWSYTGNIADSIKERVKEAGGNVVGVLRTSLSWSNHDDLDIHVMEPNGEVIFYSHKRSNASGGTLDVDMNAGGLMSRSPVENIIWTDKSRMMEGTYQVVVKNFSQRETKDVGFVVQVECNGETFDFEHHANPRHQEQIAVAQFEYTHAQGLKFRGEIKSNVVSKTKWGINTNRFQKVTQLLLSPNHWDGEVGIGNRHYMFMLENCRSDEDPRPFFNEFLKPDLDKHRKVFEVLGGKVKVPDSPNQLSGVGFSDTQKSSLIVKVTSKFARTLKINF